jgi:hypothetical protein
MAAKMKMDSVEFEEAHLMPVAEYLFAETFGAPICRYSEHLKVTQAKKTLVQAPL